jgi:uncharacterized protein YbjT (DUF2867 family)
MILITGAAGKTGLAIIKLLAQSGNQSRAFVRTKEQAGKATSAGATEITIGDLEIENDLATAMHGVDQVYFIPPNVHPNEDEIGKNAVVSALKMGVRRFVYHSVLFPQIERMPHHWRKLRVEEILIESGLDFSILQPANYMQNVLAFRSSIEKDHIWHLPYAPEARSTPVDLLDVATVAAKVLNEEKHSRATYALGGPEILSSIDIAKLLSSYLGMQITVSRQNIPEWVQSAIQAGVTNERIETLKMMFSYYDQRDFVGNSSIIEMLLDRAPTSFSEFLARDWK